MNNILIYILHILFFSCFEKQEVNIQKYHTLVNEAEHLICRDSLKDAINIYQSAFKYIDKPFGKDVFNTALASALIKDDKNVRAYLQMLINNSDNFQFIKSTFVGTYIQEAQWNDMLAQKKVQYNIELRNEFKYIHERDQLFRPLYEQHDDTIKANENINLKRINDITTIQGFPSHQELGYTEYLRGQNHDIVFHHLTQRRSRDESVIDLEPTLKSAVMQGRFDPEQAIFYMHYQNDLSKGNFEVYSVWQYKHPLLPDSLNNKLWIPKLNKEEIDEANRIRHEWHANSLQAIALKASFLSRTNLPFIFTCVRRSIANFNDNFTKEKAFEQYNMIRRHMDEYVK
jgi:hypothetical protein